MLKQQTMIQHYLRQGSETVESFYSLLLLQKKSLLLCLNALSLLPEDQAVITIVEDSGAAKKKFSRNLEDTVREAL